jgi:hypothetical protein
MKKNASQLLTLALLGWSASATAVPLCGIQPPLCEQAEAEAREVIQADCLGGGTPATDSTNQTYQFFSPWSVVLDGSGTLKLRYWFKGCSEGQLGDTPADADWTEHDYTVTGCEGSTASGSVTLHVEPGSDIVLTFVEGKLKRIFDPNSTHPRAQGRATSPFVFGAISVPPDFSKTCDQDAVEVRNHTSVCPAGVGAPATPSNGSTTGGAASKSSAAPSKNGSPKITFDKVPSSVTPGQRQTSTGEQGGAGGAKKVFFEMLEQHKYDCSQGVAESCRAAAIMLRRAKKTAEAKRYFDQACQKGSKPACSQQ